MAVTASTPRSNPTTKTPAPLARRATPGRGSLLPMRRAAGRGLAVLGHQPEPCADPEPTLLTAEHDVLGHAHLRDAGWTPGGPWRYRAPRPAPLCAGVRDCRRRTPAHRRAGTPRPGT